MLKKVDLKGCLFIEGLPGVGLVGPMAISYIIDKMEFDYIGYIECDQFPPLTSVHKSVPMPPVRIYYNSDKKLVSVFAEFAIPFSLIHEFSDKLYQFITGNGMAGIYTIGGVPKQDGGEAMFVLGSTPDLIKKAQKAGMKPIEEGVATGISALVLEKSTLDKFDNTNVLVPIDQSVIDPKYAELAIEGLNKLLNLNIDTSELDKEAKIVEAKVKEIIKRHQESHDDYKKAIEGSGPQMYA